MNARESRQTGVALLWMLAAGSASHFVFDWSGRLVVLAPFVPVNESVWEHTKLAFWPALAYLMVDPRRRSAGWGVAWVANAVAALSGPVVMIAGFYAYTAVVPHALVADLMLFAACVLVGQLLGARVYRRGRVQKRWGFATTASSIVAIVAVTVWTFAPPRLSLFRDGRSGDYGIDAGTSAQTRPR